jgi:hypothetical protein
VDQADAFSQALLRFIINRSLRRKVIRLALLCVFTFCSNPIRRADEGLGRDTRKEATVPGPRARRSGRSHPNLEPRHLRVLDAYTNRRLDVESAEPKDAGWVHGIRIGIAVSKDCGATWIYRGVAESLWQA